MRFSRTTLAIAILLSARNAPGQAQNVPEASDAYHFRYWQATANLANYTEWWYFNVYDSSNNVQAIFTYLVNNPSNMSGGLFPVGISEMAAVAFTNNGIVSETDAYFTNSFAAAYDKANVK
jgi:hypothetical protein